MDRCRAVQSSSTVSAAELAVGLIVAAVFSTGVAATQQRGYEMIWSLPRTGLRSILRQLVWVIGPARRPHHHVVRGSSWSRPLPMGHVGLVARGVGQFVLTFWFYWWSQYLLLSGRTRWRTLLPGAICMTLATTALVAVSGLVLPGQITEAVTDYGFVGAALILSIWLVVLSGVIFGGVLLGAIIVERRHAGHTQRDRPFR